MMALYGLFKGGQYGQATYEIRCQDERFHDVFQVQVNGNSVEVTRGTGATPDVVMYLDVETLYALSARRVSLRAALDSGSLSLKGSPQAIEQFRNEMNEQEHLVS